MITCCAPPARTGRRTPACATTTGLTGLTWNASSPRSPSSGTPDQAPLPRRDQEPRLAQAPHRRAEPAQPGRPGPDPPRQRLGAGHLTGRLQTQPSPARPVRRLGPDGHAGRPDSRKSWPAPAERRPGSGAGLKAPARASGKQAIQQAPTAGLAVQHRHQGRLVPFSRDRAGRHGGLDRGQLVGAEDQVEGVQRFRSAGHVAWSRSAG
jgi:hypothetical protein